jgi:hypothetical protein
LVSFLFQVHDFEEDVKLLVVRLKRLEKRSGSNFTFLYLKESVRLIIRNLAGAPEPRFHSKGIYVSRDQFGIPKIIGLKLSLLINKKDSFMVKYILTLLSIFRVFPSVQKIKLGSIIDPFSGISRTLDPDRISCAVAELRKGYSGLKLKDMTLIKLETAAPYG